MAESTTTGVAGWVRRPPVGRVLIIVLIVLLVAGIAAWRYYGARESTDDAQIDGHITPIASKVGGTVAGVRVMENQHVEAGTVLVQIDPRDYQIAVQHAEADLAEAEAELQAARTGVPLASTTTAGQVSTAGALVEQAEAGAAAAGQEVEAARARVVSARAKLREAEANSTRQARDAERLRPLVAKDEVSRQQFDAAVASAEASQAAVDSARAAVAEAEQTVHVAESRRIQAGQRKTQAQAELRTARTAPEQVSITRARARSAEAKVQQKRAALEQARLNLEYTTTKAPAKGTVSKKSVEVGQIVQPGQPLLAIVPLDDVWVTANFKETQLRDVRVSQRASIHVDAYGREYDGHVESIAAATGARFSLLPPENATGNYVKVVQRIPVRIRFEQGQDLQRMLRPGMSVVVTVVTR